MPTELQELAFRIQERLRYYWLYKHDPDVQVELYEEPLYLYLHVNVQYTRPDGRRVWAQARYPQEYGLEAKRVLGAVDEYERGAMQCVS